MRSLHGQWVARSVPALVLMLLLGACGFRPMHGERENDATIASQLAAVEIGVIKDRTGQQMRNMLIDRFYSDSRPAAAQYKLEVSIDASQEQLAVQQNSSTSRSQWTVTATYRLIHVATGRVMFQANSRAMPGFNASNYQFASYVSETGALERAMEYLAGEIKTRTALFFERAPDQRPPIPDHK